MMRTLDVAAAMELVAEGLLSRREHPSDPSLLIWNYTARTQYSKSWTPLTMACRGLITRTDGEIVARPFPKFFNLEEHVGAGRAIPNEPFDVFEKMDGSLGILYRAPDGDAIATRGSFTSPQAIEATRMLREMAREWNAARYTYLFEIIFPANRIVVNYGDRRELVLLAVIDTATGEEIAPEEVGYAPVARRYDGVTDIAACLAVAESGSEGVVIRFRESGLRLKVKLDEYVRLHRLITGVTPRKVWDVLSSGGSLAEMMEAVPEEFSGWLKGVATQLSGDFARIELSCSDYLRTVPRDVPRKEQAEVIRRHDYPAILFQMLDGKPYQSSIWKEIYPPAANAFKSQDEATA